MSKAKGFSLIELLIVVAIILIIAAIAIPNLVKSKMAANEAAAVGSTRTIVTSELTYASVYPGTGYTTLSNLYSAGFIDSVLGAGSKSGYSFSLAAAGGTPTNTFTANANPLTAGTTGTNFYCSDQTGVIQRGSSSFGTSSNPCSGGTPLGR
jgi:prepilin-type N-terminal cleavage/methylation domain-containing protein